MVRWLAPLLVIAGVEARRLEKAMEAAGFKGLPTEWWHYDDAKAATYPLADDPL
ncbi:MAG TPA: M15 family metallopeptidase [Kofleriaceae bacterium]